MNSDTPPNPTIRRYFDLKVQRVAIRHLTQCVSEVDEAKDTPDEE